MWAQGERQPRLLALFVAAATLLAACSTDTGAPTDDTPPTTATVPTSTSTTTSPAPPTSVTTTIPTTSVPPSTLAPPDLPPTTLPVPPTTSSVTDEFDDGIVLVTPDDDLAGLVAGSPRDTRFIILPGVHRTNQAEPKDGMTFEGFDGAVLNGSVILEDWATTEDGWDITGVELNMTTHGECVTGY